MVCIDAALANAKRKFEPKHKQMTAIAHVETWNLSSIGTELVRKQHKRIGITTICCLEKIDTLPTRKIQS